MAEMIRVSALVQKRFHPIEAGQEPPIPAPSGLDIILAHSGCHGGLTVPALAGRLPRSGSSTASSTSHATVQWR